MQGNNGTASHGSDGGEGGRPTFDQVLWMALGSNPAKMTSWAAFGAVFSGLATGKILLDTGRYYDFFHRRDNKWMQVGVAVGTIAACAQYCLCVVQAWRLAHHAFSDFHTIARFDALAGGCSDLLGTFFNAAASAYYTWRAHKMSGRKWWLSGFITILYSATFVLGLLLSIKGLTAPKVTLETMIRLKDFNDQMLPLRRAFGALSVASDGMVVIVMMYYLFKSRTSVFHQEKRIFHKLVVIVLETMLPPSVCILILDITAANKTVASADWRKPIRQLIPTLFYLCLLHSLVARATIRRMLDASLPSNGIHKHEVSTQGGGSRSFFVATYPEPDLDAGTDVKMDESSSTKERDLESTGEKIVPAESYRRAASPISRSSTTLNKSPTALERAV